MQHHQGLEVTSQAAEKIVWLQGFSDFFALLELVLLLS